MSGRRRDQRRQALLDFWNTCRKHDSMFQKSTLLSLHLSRRPAKQGDFVPVVFQKASNLRLIAKVPKFHFGEDDEEPTCCPTHIRSDLDTVQRGDHAPTGSPRQLARGGSTRRPKTTHTFDKPRVLSKTTASRPCSLHWPRLKLGTKKPRVLRIPRPLAKSERQIAKRSF